MQISCFGSEDIRLLLWGDKTILAMECALRPWSFIILSLLMLSSGAGSSGSTPTGESSADRLALLSIMSAVSDASGALASWGSTSLHCQWRGVQCGDRGGESRVTSLELQLLKLEGKLSPSLANLTFLEALNLSHNSLQGPIPQELGLLSQIRYLDLSHNSLGGTIPPSLFEDCPQLQSVSLGAANLGGTIPRSLKNCVELRHIDFHENNLEGPIPSELCSLLKLERLSLYSNGLTGSIPPDIGNLSRLTGLYLSVNHLSGSIPATIGNLSSLSELHLNINNLTGGIPSAMGNLSSLSLLLMYANSLTGTIPPEIGNLVSLVLLHLHGNRLVGTIPEGLGNLTVLDALILSDNMLEAKNAAEWSFLDALANCTRLRVLILSGNPLGGVLPKSIANLSKSLDTLILADSQIAGSIPAEIGNLVNLTRLNMSSNLLSGTLPAALGSLRMLVSLDLSRNRFVGEIPATLGNLIGLNVLVLASNQLNGAIPSSLGNCSLNTLNLELNELTGKLPKEILSGSSFSIIFNVSHNSLTGPLPPEIGNLSNIPTIDVSNNNFSGEIPTTLAECIVLQNLYLQGNHFEGSIPSSFSEIRGLEVLDVSSNNLTGPIPNFIRRFHRMIYLNLSYNNFDGQVPDDGMLFSNTSAFSVAGNIKLCGGVPELNLPSCSPGKKHLSAKLIAIVSVAGGILCLVAFVSVFVARHRFRRSRRLSSANLCIKEPHRKVSFAELLRATDGFSFTNLLGMGSFGTVYKGVIVWENNKDNIAVKVLNLEQEGALKSFMAECEALRNISHRNLVKILTSCSSVDFRGNDFKALVFEFLPNGSLDRWLHPQANKEGESRTLSLVQRLNISIDVASALTYLHHHGPTPLVHCDLKPSNVLLDNNLVARVADFGLAKFLSESTRSVTSFTLKGSIGYVPPEYGMNSGLSAEGDVYSYGILLLEMFTGKRPTDETFIDGLNLHTYVEMALRKGVSEIIDPKLLVPGEGEQEGITDLPTTKWRMGASKCITLVFRVGILCSKQSPKERMLIKDVARELQGIRDAFLESVHDHPWYV